MSMPMAITMMEAANLDRYSRPTKKPKNNAHIASSTNVAFLPTGMRRFVTTNHRNRYMTRSIAASGADDNRQTAKHADPFIGRLIGVSAKN